MKEIGGYFGLDDLVSNEYYKDLVSVNTGSNALLYLMEANKIQKIYIPYYLCDSVSNALKRANFAFEYYHVDSKFMPIFEKELSGDEYLYIVNLYGQISNDRVVEMSNKYGRIILDNTHAFFQQPIEGVETVYSVRKFFGVSDGAYLSTKATLNVELDTDVSKDRMVHILGRYEGAASDYYQSFHDNYNVIKQEPLKRMSKLTKNLLGAIDYERVRSKRNENYAYLNNRLQEINGIQPVTPEGPYAYPFYAENGVEIRKRLALEGIYIPTLWPDVLVNMPMESIEYQYVSNILPLPCDQRYDVKDMEYVVDVLLTKMDSQKGKLSIHHEV